MDSRAFKQLAVTSLSCFLVIPHPRAFSVGLRDEAVTYRVEGYELQQRGDAQGALSAYQKAAALDPSYPTPHNDVGVLLEGMGQLEDARRSYEQALTIDPNYLEAHTNLAILSERLGDTEKAIYHWMKRYQLGDPEDAWTARAEERLMALGVLASHPELKSKIYSSRRVVEKELQAHEQSLEAFHAVTEQDSTWP
jgi:tetratricopeptide (TPR) repeat protein